jgi:hypothetical protein
VISHYSITVSKLRKKNVSNWCVMILDIVLDQSARNCFKATINHKKKRSCYILYQKGGFITEIDSKMASFYKMFDKICQT